MRFRAPLVLVAACSFTHGAGLGVDGATSDGPPVDGRQVDAPIAATCSDGMLDGNETAIDCGGGCAPCAVGQACGVHADCLGSVCDTSGCRYAAQCNELHLAQPALGDASYTIDPDGAGGAAPFATSCDMTVDGGGWTLVGKVDGRYTMPAAWLVSAVNAAALQTPTIDAASYACIDAVELAVDHSTEIRLSNSARSAWVKWPLPAGRAVATWWHHAVGQTTIAAATQSAVTVTASTGTTSACFQNIYGIIPYSQHGGSYPFAAKNATGNTTGGDNCMAIGTMIAGATADGFTQNGNGFDAPSDETTWPNPAYDITPHVAVWLR